MHTFPPGGVHTYALGSPLPTAHGPRAVRQLCVPRSPSKRRAHASPCQPSPLWGVGEKVAPRHPPQAWQGLSVPAREQPLTGGTAGSAGRAAGERTGRLLRVPLLSTQPAARASGPGHSTPRPSTTYFSAQACKGRLWLSERTGTSVHSEPRCLARRGPRTRFRAAGGARSTYRASGVPRRARGWQGLGAWVTVWQEKRRGP